MEMKNGFWIVFFCAANGGKLQFLTSGANCFHTPTKFNLIIDVVNAIIIAFDIVLNELKEILINNVSLFRGAHRGDLKWTSSSYCINVFSFLSRLPSSFSQCLKKIRNNWFETSGLVQWVGFGCYESEWTIIGKWIIISQRSLKFFGNFWRDDSFFMIDVCENCNGF